MKLRNPNLQDKVKYFKTIFISKNFLIEKEWDNIEIEEDKINFIFSKRNTKGYKNILEYRRSLKSINMFYDLLKKLEKLGVSIVFERYEIYYGDDRAKEIWGEIQSNRAITLENCIKRFGEEQGKIRFEKYCEKQAYTNTYEYKLKTGKIKNHEEFEQYNKSRATTYDNLLKKYGEEEAIKRWDEYRKKQAYTNTKEHLGDNYEYINFLKSHTFDSYLVRYKDEEIAKQKLDEYFSKSSLNYSKISQKLFKTIIELYPFKDYQDSIYFAEYNKEYGVYNEITKKYNLYDFVCTELKFVIEFHGDHYHGNPKIYRPQQKLRGKGCTKITAEQAWAKDENKKNNIIRNRNFIYICIWESDYKTDPEYTANRIIEYVKENCL